MTHSSDRPTVMTRIETDKRQESSALWCWPNMQLIDSMIDWLMILEAVSVRTSIGRRVFVVANPVLQVLSEFYCECMTFVLRCRQTLVLTVQLWREHSTFRLYRLSKYHDRKDRQPAVVLAAVSSSSFVDHVPDVDYLVSADECKIRCWRYQSSPAPVQRESHWPKADDLSFVDYVRRTRMPLTRDQKGSSLCTDPIDLICVEAFWLCILTMMFDLDKSREDWCIILHSEVKLN